MASPSLTMSDASVFIKVPDSSSNASISTEITGNTPALAHFLAKTVASLISKYTSTNVSVNAIMLSLWKGFFVLQDFHIDFQIKADIRTDGIHPHPSPILNVQRCRVKKLQIVWPSFRHPTEKVNIILNGVRLDLAENTRISISDTVAYPDNECSPQSGTSKQEQPRLIDDPINLPIWLIQKIYPWILDFINFSFFDIQVTLKMNSGDSLHIEIPEISASHDMTTIHHQTSRNAFLTPLAVSAANLTEVTEKLVQIKNLGVYWQQRSASSASRVPLLRPWSADVVLYFSEVLLFAEVYLAPLAVTIPLGNSIINHLTEFIARIQNALAFNQSLQFKRGLDLRSAKDRWKFAIRAVLSHVRQNMQHTQQDFTEQNVLRNRQRKRRYVLLLQQIAQASKAFPHNHNVQKQVSKLRLDLASLEKKMVPSEIYECREVFRRMRTVHAPSTTMSATLRARIAAWLQPYAPKMAAWFQYNQFEDREVYSPEDYIADLCDLLHQNGVLDADPKDPILFKTGLKVNMDQLCIYSPLQDANEALRLVVSSVLVDCPLQSIHVIPLGVVSVDEIVLQHVKGNVDTDILVMKGAQYEEPFMKIAVIEDTERSANFSLGFVKLFVDLHVCIPIINVLLTQLLHLNMPPFLSNPKVSAGAFQEILLPVKIEGSLADVSIYFKENRNQESPGVKLSIHNIRVTFCPDTDKLELGLKHMSMMVGQLNHMFRASPSEQLAENPTVADITLMNIPDILLTAYSLLCPDMNCHVASGNWKITLSDGMILNLLTIADFYLECADKIKLHEFFTTAHNAMQNKQAVGVIVSTSEDDTKQKSILSANIPNIGIFVLVFAASEDPIVKLDLQLNDIATKVHLCGDSVAISIDLDSIKFADGAMARPFLKLNPDKEKVFAAHVNILIEEQAKVIGDVGTLQLFLDANCILFWLEAFNSAYKLVDARFQECKQLSRLTSENQGKPCVTDDSVETNNSPLSMSVFVSGVTISLVHKDLEAFHLKVMNFLVNKKVTVKNGLLTDNTHIRIKLIKITDFNSRKNQDFLTVGDEPCTVEPAILISMCQVYENNQELPVVTTVIAITKTELMIMHPFLIRIIGISELCQKRIREVLFSDMKSTKNEPESMSAATRQIVNPKSITQIMLSDISVRAPVDFYTTESFIIRVKYLTLNLQNLPETPLLDKYVLGNEHKMIPDPQNNQIDIGVRGACLYAFEALAGEIKPRALMKNVDIDIVQESVMSNEDFISMTDIVISKAFLSLSVEQITSISRVLSYNVARIVSSVPASWVDYLFSSSFTNERYLTKVDIVSISLEFLATKRRFLNTGGPRQEALFGLISSLSVLTDGQVVQQEPTITLTIVNVASLELNDMRSTCLEVNKHILRLGEEGTVIEIVDTISKQHMKIENIRPFIQVSIDFLVAVFQPVQHLLRTIVVPNFFLAESTEESLKEPSEPQPAFTGPTVVLDLKGDIDVNFLQFSSQVGPGVFMLKVHLDAKIEISEFPVGNVEVSDFLLQYVAPRQIKKLASNGIDVKKHENDAHSVLLKIEKTSLGLLEKNIVIEIESIFICVTPNEIISMMSIFDDIIPQFQKLRIPQNKVETVVEGPTSASPYNPKVSIRGETITASILGDRATTRCPGFKIEMKTMMDISLHDGIGATIQISIDYYWPLFRIWQPLLEPSKLDFNLRKIPYIDLELSSGNKLDINITPAIIGSVLQLAKPMDPGHNLFSDNLMPDSVYAKESFFAQNRCGETVDCIYDEDGCVILDQSDLVSLPNINETNPVVHLKIRGFVEKEFTMALNSTHKKEVELFGRSMLSLVLFVEHHWKFHILRIRSNLEVLNFMEFQEFLVGFRYDDGTVKYMDKLASRSSQFVPISFFRKNLKSLIVSTSQNTSPMSKNLWEQEMSGKFLGGIGSSELKVFKSVVDSSSLCLFAVFQWSKSAAGDYSLSIKPAFKIVNGLPNSVKLFDRESIYLLKDSEETHLAHFREQSHLELTLCEDFFDCKPAVYKFFGVFDENHVPQEGLYKSDKGIFIKCTMDNEGVWNVLLCCDLWVANRLYGSSLMIKGDLKPLDGFHYWKSNENIEIREQKIALFAVTNNNPEISVKTNSSEWSQRTRLLSEEGCKPLSLRLEKHRANSESVPDLLCNVVFLEDLRQDTYVLEFEAPVSIYNNLPGKRAIFVRQSESPDEILIHGSMKKDLQISEVLPLTISFKLDDAQWPWSFPIPLIWDKMTEKEWICRLVDKYKRSHCFCKIHIHPSLQTPTVQVIVSECDPNQVPFRIRNVSSRLVHIWQDEMDENTKTQVGKDEEIPFAWDDPTKSLKLKVKDSEKEKVYSISLDKIEKVMSLNSDLNISIHKDGPQVEVLLCDSFVNVEDLDAKAEKMKHPIDLSVSARASIPGLKITVREQNEHRAPSLIDICIDRIYTTIESTVKKEISCELRVGQLEVHNILKGKTDQYHTLLGKYSESSVAMNQFIYARGHKRIWNKVRVSGEKRLTRPIVVISGKVDIQTIMISLEGELIASLARLIGDSQEFCRSNFLNHSSDQVLRILLPAASEILEKKHPKYESIGAGLHKYSDEFYVDEFSTSPIGVNILVSLTSEQLRKTIRNLTRSDQMGVMAKIGSRTLASFIGTTEVMVEIPSYHLRSLFGTPDVLKNKVQKDLLRIICASAPQIIASAIFGRPKHFFKRIENTNKEPVVRGNPGGGLAELSYGKSAQRGLHFKPS